MLGSPFDDELAEAYAALAEEAAVPEANRRALFQRLLPTLGLGAAAVVVVGLIGSYAYHARSTAAHLTPVHATHQPSQPTTAPAPHSPVPPTPNAPVNPPGQPGGAGTGHAALGVHDLALRYAYTWANRGGGLDPAARATHLAAMRGQEAPASVPEPDGEGMQVVLHAHVADVAVRASTHVVTVALLLAGPEAPVWAALQVGVVPSATGGWTVAGDPAWVAFPTSGKALAAATPTLTWVPPEQSTSREQLTAFFTQFGQAAMVHDPAIVAKPISGLGGAMQFDQLEGVATEGNSTTLYARVRWKNPSGLGMSQVYRLNVASTGGIDSVEVAAIQ